jgi:hypothetical protein
MNASLEAIIGCVDGRGKCRTLRGNGTGQLLRQCRFLTLRALATCFVNGAGAKFGMPVHYFRIAE